MREGSQTDTGSVNCPNRTSTTRKKDDINVSSNSIPNNRPQISLASKIPTLIGNERLSDRGYDPVLNINLRN